MTEPKKLYVWVEVNAEGLTVEQQQRCVSDLDVQMTFVLDLFGSGREFKVVRVSPECVGAILEAWRKCRKDPKS